MIVDISILECTCSQKYRFLAGFGLPKNQHFLMHLVLYSLGDVQSTVHIIPMDSSNQTVLWFEMQIEPGLILNF